MKAVLCLLFCAAAVMAADKTVYDFTLNSIDGQPAPLAAYRGKVVLLVNVASRFGFTPQYTATAGNVDQENDFAPVGRERRRLAIDRIQRSHTPSYPQPS